MLKSGVKSSLCGVRRVDVRADRRCLEIHCSYKRSSIRSDEVDDSTVFHPMLSQSSDVEFE